MIKQKTDFLVEDFKNWKRKNEIDPKSTEGGNLRLFIIFLKEEKNTQFIQDIYELIKSSSIGPLLLESQNIKNMEDFAKFF